jgi:hypothetical protein
LNATGPIYRRQDRHKDSVTAITDTVGPGQAVPAGPNEAVIATRAGKGDERAWDALVERYSPLIWSICRRHRLGDADARAVSRSIWRQLVNQLDEVRDPGALAGWLAAAAWRECGNARPSAGRPQIAGAGHQPVIRPGRASGNDS